MIAIVMRRCRHVVERSLQNLFIIVMVGIIIIIIIAVIILIIIVLVTMHRHPRHHATQVRKFCMAI